MRSTLAQAIRTARLASGLTQEALGRRLGLKGRAVYRWERDASAPRKRHRNALVTAINAVNQSAGAALAGALARESKGASGNVGVGVGVGVLAPPAAAHLIEPKLVLELTVFALADELDLPARRLRGALSKLFAKMRDANLTLEDARRLLVEWNDAAGVH